MYEDFYDEPSEFEIQVEEFKESLKLAVKTEFQEELKRLKEENASLREIKKNWQTINSELKAEKHKLEIAIANAERDAEKKAKKARLSELLEAFTKPAWGCSGEYEYVREKCDKCDEDGFIHYTSPQGRPVKEQECTCEKCGKRFKVTPELQWYYTTETILGQTTEEEYEEM